MRPRRSSRWIATLGLSGSMLVLVGGILLLPGCDFFGPQDCQLRGCRFDDGLEVTFVGTPDDSFVLTATSFMGETRTLDCTTECEATVFRGFSPGGVTIRYESGSRTVDHTFRPDYERNRPNGPDCGPVCASGTVEFDLDGPA